MLTVTTAAPDRLLLTTEEIRAAVGVSDASYDTALASLNARVAAALTRQCCVPAAGATPPTLRQETLTEVIRDVCGARYLLMSRKPIVSVTSVVVDGTTLDAEDYEADAGNGYLYKLTDDERVCWSATKITAVYLAGWDVVPEDLKLAASKFAKILWSEDGPNSRSDPNLKRQRIEDVGEREWWVPPAADTLLSAEVRDLLVPFSYRTM